MNLESYQWIVGSWLHDRCDFNLKYCMNIGSIHSAKNNPCFNKAIHMLSITCFESSNIDIPPAKHSFRWGILFLAC